MAPIHRHVHQRLRPSPPLHLNPDPMRHGHIECVSKLLGGDEDLLPAIIEKPIKAAQEGLHESGEAAEVEGRRRQKRCAVRGRLGPLPRSSLQSLAQQRRPLLRPAIRPVAYLLQKGLLLLSELASHLLRSQATQRLGQYR